MNSTDILDIFSNPDVFINLRIYSPQKIDNGVRFGLHPNKTGCGVCEVVYEDGYVIKFIKVQKPRYSNVTKTFTPPNKKVKQCICVNTSEEVVPILAERLGVIL